MSPNHGDDVEFTDEQLRAALKGVGDEARREAFAAGRPVVFFKDNAIVALYADGSERILETLKPDSLGC
jgi:hypothetical protein